MNKQNQNGSVHIIIISVVALLVVGAIGYLFWNNFVKTNNAQKDKTENSKVAANPSTSPSPTPNVADNTGYLVLDEWGVKFKAPDSIGEIHYYKKTSQPDKEGLITEFYEFSSKRVEELGGQCVEPNSQNMTIRLAVLSRSKVKTEQENLHSSTLVNNKPIDDYYYYTTGGQSVCSDNSADLQKQDRDAIYNAILKLLPL